jgi:thymidylate kinase
LIYCSAPNDVIEERFKEHDEKDLTPNQFKEVLERYEMFLEKTSLPVLRLDTTKSREENKELMKQFIEQ